MKLITIDNCAYPYKVVNAKTGVIVGHYTRDNYSLAYLHSISGYPR